MKHEQSLSSEFHPWHWNSYSVGPDVGIFELRWQFSMHDRVLPLRISNLKTASLKNHPSLTHLEARHSDPSMTANAVFELMLYCIFWKMTDEGFVVGIK